MKHHVMRLSCHSQIINAPFRSINSQNIIQSFVPVFRILMKPQNVGCRLPFHEKKQWCLFL